MEEGKVFQGSGTTWRKAWRWGDAGTTLGPESGTWGMVVRAKVGSQVRKSELYLISNGELERFSEQGLAWWYWCSRKATQSGRLHRRLVCGPGNPPHIVIKWTLSEHGCIEFKITDPWDGLPLSSHRVCLLCVLRAAARFELCIFHTFTHLMNIYFFVLFFLFN